MVVHDEGRQCVLNRKRTKPGEFESERYSVKNCGEKGKPDRKGSGPAIIMNCRAVKVYPFFSHEKGCASVRVSKTGLRKALVCVSEFDIAQKTDVLNFGQQS